MTEREKELVVEFLEDFSDVISWRCCCDWDFPKDWTKKERLTFTRELYKWRKESGRYDDDDDDEVIREGKEINCLPGDAVADYLAYKVKMEV